MFLDPGGNGKDIGVKDNVLRRETNFLREDVIRASANGDFAFKRVCLTFLIERHYDNRRAIQFHDACLPDELVLAFLK